MYKFNYLIHPLSLCSQVEELLGNMVSVRLYKYGVCGVILIIQLVDHLN